MNRFITFWDWFIQALLIYEAHRPTKTMGLFIKEAVAASISLGRRTLRALYWGPLYGSHVVW